MMLVNRSQYLLLFVDDFFRFQWFYMMAQKSQVLDLFKHFIALMKKQYITRWR